MFRFPSWFPYNQSCARCCFVRPRVCGGAASAQEPAQNRREFTIVAKDHVFTPDKLEVSQDDLVKITLRSEDVPGEFRDRRLSHREARRRARRR